MRIHASICILAGLLLAGAVQAQQVEFNYEGRVMVDGLPFDGPGYFKFAIVHKDGNLTLWSNDATSATGEEPARAVIVDVTDGVFNVIIGDASGTGMEPLDASLFNVDERVSLRVWFSDTGVAGSFETLKPDRAIANPSLLGTQSYNEIDLYVDSLLGDDRNPGLKPQRPKRTIQAAWDALPALIHKNATIHLADGIYRESVYLKAKTMVADATISIIGNPSNPNAVRITGADEGAETSPIRQRGFHIVSQSNLFLQGLLFDYFSLHGVTVEDYSNVDFADCKFMHNTHGLAVYSRSIIMGRNLEAGNGLTSFYFAPVGFYIANSSATFYDCVAHHLYHGLAVRQSDAQIYGLDASYCDYGAHPAIFSMISFRDTHVNRISNCGIGVQADAMAIVYGISNNVIYSGNGKNYELLNNSIGSN